jgi:flavodoxin
MAGVLVAYFSRSGVTEKLATHLAGKLRASLEPVKPEASYAGRSGFVRGIWQSLLRLSPAVGCELDPADYSVVIIGSPVWAGRLSAPMRSYLKRFRGRTGAVAAFWVSGSGQDYSGVRSEIERLTGQALVATAGFNEREVLGNTAGPKLETLAQAIRARLPDAALTPRPGRGTPAG